MIAFMNFGLQLRILVLRGRLFVGNDFIYHLLIYLFAFLLFFYIGYYYFISIQIKKRLKINYKLI